MKPTVLILIALLVSLSTVACVQRVDGSGRTQLAFYSDEKMNALGSDAYAKILATEKRSQDAEAIAILDRVGKRLAAVAPNRGFTYEFTLLESPTVNAFCLPGGKVAVYTGILGLCENEAGLAAVLGHEIAHAIADHGNERMSQGVLIQGAQQGLALALENSNVKATTANLSMAAFGLGAQIGVMLPFSRSHELEADELGLEYMAKAGYDPEQAVLFWQRFATLGNGGTPAFLSTHPPSEDRAQALIRDLPKAKRWYAAAAQQSGAGASLPAKYARKL